MLFTGSILNRLKLCPKLPVVCAGIAIFLSFITYQLQDQILLNLADEGYLWYGVKQTLSGAVTIVDFQGYDPGRYYWCAFWSLFGGDDLMTLRKSTRIFQAIGVFFALLSAKRLTRSPCALVLIGVVICSWMFPRHKLFEPTISLIAVYVSIRLIEDRRMSSFLISGILVGLAAVFGRNMGVYLLLSFTGLISLLWLKDKKIPIAGSSLYFIIGIGIGWLPNLILLIFVKGYFAAYMNSVIEIIERGSTNLSLPVPWVWTIEKWQLDWRTLIQATKGIFFLLLPVFTSIAIGLAIIVSDAGLRKYRLFFAAGIIQAVFQHHGLTRADFSHLSQAAQPLILMLLCAPWLIPDKHRSTKVFGVYTVFLIFLVAGAIHASPLGARIRLGDQLVMTQIGPNKILTLSRNHEIVSKAQALNQKIGKLEELLVIPYLPGLYPILNRKSPLKTTYFLWGASDAEQDNMILELDAKRVSTVIMGDIPLDGREDLRFSRRYPRVYEYILKSFEVVSRNEFFPAYRLYKRTLPGK